MELYIFARFRVREGQELPAAKVLAEQVGAARSEPGCLAIGAFRSTRDPLLFFIHSRWADEAAFEIHAELPHTVRFLALVEPLIDHPLEVTRTLRLDAGL